MTDSDDEHCGMCDNACESPTECRAGECQCPSVDEVFCAGAGGCITTDSDPDNCGGCDIKCSDTEECCSGSCVNPMGNDVMNCGSCGNVCGNNADNCTGGMCMCGSNPACDQPLAMVCNALSVCFAF